MPILSLTRRSAFRRSALFVVYGLTIAVASGIGIGFLLAWLHIRPLKHHLVITFPILMLNDMPLVIATAIATWLSLPREHRGLFQAQSIAHLGKPYRLGGGFLAGFAAIILLSLALWSLGAAHLQIDTPNFLDLLLYIPAFFLVAFAEETMLRGALLFWLSRSIGFSSAALLSSIAFGLLHTGNGEPLLGAFSAGLIGLFFCLTLRATGSLWFAIGFHTAWDYGQSALLGCRDSGLASTGAWLNMVPHGPAWLSGGEAGPEGSVLCLAGIGLGCVALARRPSRMAINIGDEHTSHYDRTTDQRA